MSRGEHKIGKYRVDGYNKRYNISIEFHGTYWHGFHDKKSEKYIHTKERESYLRDRTNLIVIWEHEWKNSPYSTIHRVVNEINEIKEAA